MEANRMNDTISCKEKLAYYLQDLNPTDTFEHSSRKLSYSSKPEEVMASIFSVSSTVSTKKAIRRRIQQKKQENLAEAFQKICKLKESKIKEVSGSLEVSPNTPCSKVIVFNKRTRAKRRVSKIMLDQQAI